MTILKKFILKLQDEFSRHLPGFSLLPSLKFDAYSWLWAEIKWSLIL